VNNSLAQIDPSPSFKLSMICLSPGPVIQRSMSFVLAKGINISMTSLVSLKYSTSKRTSPVLDLGIGYPYLSSSPYSFCSCKVS